MGENYTMMALYFPNRTQRQLKNKGKKENMINPDRVNEAIRSRRPIGKLIPIQISQMRYNS